ncbi:MAG: hypothetical protein KY459_10865 [Acidobacteria bacterium]|nr:hypothetical protein [Acidobacteriota bacterium]
MKKLTLTVAALMALAGCDDVARESSPVELVATVTPDVVQLVDLADPVCPDLVTVVVNAIAKNPLSEETFLDVRLTRMRVSYRRTDGGTLRPSSFVRTISGLVPIGGTASVNTRVFQADATNEAPFAALMPSNGGVDPETGRRVVQMDVILEIFGETLSGENVATSVSFPVDFCFNCGGCA